MIRLTRRKPQPQEEAPAERLVSSGEDAASESATAIDEADQTPAEESELDAPAAPSRPARETLHRALVFGLLPGLAMLLAGGVGYLKWQKSALSETQDARTGSVQAATDSTIKILSYNPDTVDHDLDDARDRLTGTFRDAYTQLAHDVVIPGAKQKKISAVATVPAAASVSATPNRAVVMVFVNQSIVVGDDPPSSTASTVRVTVDKQDHRWLISDFTPI